MIQLDYGLICLAVISLIMRPNIESLKLLGFFGGSVLCVELLVNEELFEPLAELWLIIYAGWIAGFAINTKNRHIAILYCCQAVSCMLMLLSWHFQLHAVLVYNSYILTIAGLYTMQVMVSHGNSDSGFGHSVFNRLVNLAHMGFRKWK